MEIKQSIKTAHIALATAIILLVPLIAMQFTDEVVWDFADFVVAGILLFGTGLAFRLVAGRFAKRSHRIAVSLALASALLLVWAQLAVGLV